MRKLIFLIIVFLILAVNIRWLIAGEIIGYDGFERKIVLSKAPERIVCVSATPIQTIFALGAGNRIVGIPTSVIRHNLPPYKSAYPELIEKYPQLLDKETIGNFSKPNIEKIISLKPDLVIIYDSLDRPGEFSSVFEGRNITIAIFHTPIDIESGLKQIKKIGLLLGKKDDGDRLYKELKQEIEKLRGIYSKKEKKPLVWVSWRGGSYGKKSVINELIDYAGGINLAKDFDKQWVELSLEYVIAANPDIIITLCFQKDEYRSKVLELKNNPKLANISAIKNNRIYAVDGHSFFSPIGYPKTIKKLGELFKK